MPADHKPFAAWIGLGSNLGDRRETFRSAIAEIGKFADVVAISSVYETTPVEFTEQPVFLNAVVEIRTSQPPLELLQSLLQIELRHGRDRKQQPAKGPRTLDLDLLLIEQDSHPLTMSSPELTLPHRAMQQRRFVLMPLAEIAPERLHPLLGKSIVKLLAELPLENETTSVTNSGEL